MFKLDDKEIRLTLISRLSTYKDCKVFQEVTVPSGKARADIVAVNGHVVAYEIKSDFDSIKRLENQIQEFDKSFEMNYVVVGVKYSKSISNIVPDYWGIIIAEKTKQNTTKLKFLRRAKINPNLSFKNFISFLTAEEVKKIASMEEYLGKKLSKSKIRSLFKQEIIKLLDENLPKYLKLRLKNQVRFLLKNS